MNLTDPTPLTKTEDTTTFNFWESSVITLYNSASLSGGRVGGNLAAWLFGRPDNWTYVPNSPPPGYLHDVARKGVENHPGG